MGTNGASSYHNGNGLLNDSNLNDSSLMNPNGVNQMNGTTGNTGGPNSAANMQSNIMFEKILSEVIHVSAYDQRSSMNGVYSNDPMGGGSNLGNPPLQDMPFKFKG